MSNQTQSSAHNVLEDPLSGATRSTKRSLIVFSCIAVLVVLTGVSPDEVSVFGLKFPGLTLSILNGGILTLLALSIITFLIYGFSDFFRFRHRLDVYNHCRANDINKGVHNDPNSYEAQQQKYYEEEFIQITGYKPFEIPHRPTKILIAVRISLDLIIPFAFGLIAMALFIFKHLLK
ncbi:MAG: hypothetical protein AAGC47_07525 [Bacteroidota bacterium]